MRKIECEADVTELLRAAKALSVMSAWSGAGLFALLKGGPRPLRELPGDPRAIEITAVVLRHLGLLVGDDEAVGLSPAALGLLQRGEMPGERDLEFLRDASRMLEVLRHGGPVRDEDGASKGTEGGVRRDSPEKTAAFLDMLYRMSKESAELTLSRLRPLVPEGGAVLDLGGGHGRYGRLFADAGFRVTLFDLPHVIEYARARHGDALGYLPGDFHQAGDLGGPYDLILLSNIVHGESDENNGRLIGRLARALGTGGHLVIKDMFIDEQGADPENAVLFGLTMLCYTDKGRSPRIADARRWLESAGLDDTRVTPLGSFTLVRGRRGH